MRKLARSVIQLLPWSLPATTGCSGQNAKFPETMNFSVSPFSKTPKLPPGDLSGNATLLNGLTKGFSNA